MKPCDIRYQWISEFDRQAVSDIVQLVDCSVQDGGVLGYEQPLTPKQADQFIASLQEGVASGGTSVLLGRVRHDPAFMALLYTNRMTNCCHRAELAKGIVHPLYRGKRLLQLAFEEIIHRAESMGIQQLVLDVREGTRAHRLWQLFGFETYGVLEDYARVQGIAHRGHYMVQNVESLRQRFAIMATPISSL